MGNRKRLGKILVVDDDPVSVFITRNLLQRINASDSIVFLKNGEEALDFILNCSEKTGEKLCPELILLDYKMPVMDGKEFMEALNQQGFVNRRDVVVIVTSASMIEEEYKEMRHLGCSGFVEKPLDRNKLDRLLEKYFHISIEA